MKRATDAEKVAFIMARLRDSDLPPAFAQARRIYEDSVTAESALRYARALGAPDKIAAAERNAALHAALWEACLACFTLYDGE